MNSPTTARVLRSVLQQLDSGIAPEVTSERGRYLLDMIGYMLRYVVARDEGMLAGIEELTRGQTDVLQRLEGATESREAEHSAAARKGLEGAFLAGKHDRLAREIEQQVSFGLRTRTVHDAASDTKQAALKAAIAAEISAIDELTETIARVGTPSGSASVDSCSELTPERVERHFRKHAAPGSRIKVVQIKRPTVGMSKDTFLLELAGDGRPADKVVIRRDAALGPVEGTVLDEVPRLRALRKSGVPVPEVLWTEPDPTALGAPFIVMKFVEGAVASDSSGRVLVDDPRQAALAFAGLLAGVHRTDISHLDGSSGSDKRNLRSHLEEQLDRIEAQWHSRRLWPSSVLTAAFAWMRAHMPDDARAPVIVHGDASLRNVMFHRGAITALLDWELAHIGDANEDLAYCRADIERMLPWDEFLKEYYNCGGFEYLPQNQRYWEIWTGLRNAVLSASGIHSFVASDDVGLAQAWAGTLHHFHFLRAVAAGVLE